MLFVAASAGTALAAEAAPPTAAEGFFDARLPVDLKGDVVARAANPAVLGLGGALSLAVEGEVLEIVRESTTRVAVVHPLTGSNYGEFYNAPREERRTFEAATASVARAGAEATAFAHALDAQAFTADATGPDAVALVSAAPNADLSTYDYAFTIEGRGEAVDVGLTEELDYAHFRIESDALSVTAVGNFTIFLWDADLVVEPASGSPVTYTSGWRETGPGLAAREEEVANVVVTVTNGRLTLEKAAWTGVHAPVLDVALAGEATLRSAVGGFSKGEDRYESAGQDVALGGDLLFAFTLLSDRTDRALVSLAGDVQSVSLRPAAKLDRGAFLGASPVAAAATAGSVVLLIAGAVLVMRQRDRLVVKRGIDGEAAAAAGVFALELGDDEMATAELSVALAAKPQDVPLLIANGAALEHMGRIEDARNAYERAVRADPSRGEAHYYYARALAQLGLSASALPHLQRALALDPRMREMARGDSGFRTFSDHPTFAAIIA